MALLDVLSPYAWAFKAAVVAIVAGGVWYYGHHEYTAGYHDRDVVAQQQAAQLLAESRTKELAAQTQMEKVRHDALQQKQVADTAVAAARTESDRLRDEIARQRAKLATAKSTSRNDAAAARAWQLLDTCRARYEAVARDADRYVEQLRIAQGWARVIEAAK